ncbi:hypothetical protein SAMN05192574_101293 [Mucilaginibacter gossypiicola]|uniref:Uncharacterized protein n=1 Tax=Mucilaginibacter gossypiicola TaxID=551995 RepID=A0A1H7ZZK0_9SPHI|nr:hypothetical protein SAMN05192574_101293 [Mucilaginibacter gossypiicola]
MAGYVFHFQELKIMEHHIICNHLAANIYTKKGLTYSLH